MFEVQLGRYKARISRDPGDLDVALALRAACFKGNPTASDRDGFDPQCDHALIEDSQTGQLLCCFRLLLLPNGTKVESTYAAQFYDLSPLFTYANPMVEVGRFCVSPSVSDTGIVRLAWGLLTRFVEMHNVGMLFGCTSFKGTDGTQYQDTFKYLRMRYLAPENWMPVAKAPETYDFLKFGMSEMAYVKRALETMPPLLRSYLSMGGWVSDHSVVDRDLNTLHVFTGLETACIPLSRVRALRGVLDQGLTVS